VASVKSSEVKAKTMGPGESIEVKMK